MADLVRSTIIKDNPIRNGLDAFRCSFTLLCERRSVSCGPDALGQLGRQDTDVQNLTLDLLSALRSLPATCLLPSKTGLRSLWNDLLRLIGAVAADDFDSRRIRPLFNAVLAGNPCEKLIWDEVYRAVSMEVLHEVDPAGDVILSLQIERQAIEKRGMTKKKKKKEKKRKRSEFYTIYN
ncbi:hypothetical protein C8A00DRAFT_18648 [Chaetomidium leptoderma]|uniref:Uncharacterized protein n=1 Tax=Chaetomidium leptoderma TaxID=669021 RepID=A0AAN6VEN7_9PEZI|nr:hypothetical protein C8A00DRAFT_18648 [Chaetomidium leptoderma]